ncbi:MAG: DUF2917 domain-containing protein [Hyphomicrobiaceae bacterium]
MTPLIDADVVSVKARGIHRIEDGAGWLIECLSGVLWITQHADHRDITLAAGASFRLDRPGLAIVYALQPARLRVVRCAAPARRRTALRPLPRKHAA